MPVESKLTGHDAAIVMTEAQYQRLHGNKNGWGNERLHRVIGEIPLSDFNAMQQAANNSGDYLSGDDLKAYLVKNPQYRTVNAIDTGATGNIIIK